MTGKTAALLQLAGVLFLVGFSTVELFRGNLEAGLSVVPILAIYYIFVVSRQRKD